MAQTRKPAIPLTTFSMRVSPHQMARLDALRARTLLPITEHIRRAIDLYLSKVEKGVDVIPMAPITAPSPPTAGEVFPSQPAKTPSQPRKARVASQRISYR